MVRNDRHPYDNPDDPQYYEYSSTGRSYQSDSMYAASSSTPEDTDMLDIKPDIRRLKEFLHHEAPIAEAKRELARPGILKRPSRRAESPPVIRFLKPRRGSPLRNRPLPHNDENRHVHFNMDGSLVHPNRFSTTRSVTEGDGNPVRPQMPMVAVKCEPMDEFEDVPTPSMPALNPMNVKNEIVDHGYPDDFRQPPVLPQMIRRVPEHRPMFYGGGAIVRRPDAPILQRRVEPGRPLSVIRPIPSTSRPNPTVNFNFPVIHTSQHILPPPKSGFVYSVKGAPQPSPPTPPVIRPIIKPLKSILKRRSPIPTPDGEPRKRGRPRIHPVRPQSDPPRKRGRPRKYPEGSSRYRPRNQRPVQPIDALRFRSQLRYRSVDWSRFDDNKAFYDKQAFVLGEWRTFKLCSCCLDALYDENVSKTTLRSHFARCRAEFRHLSRR